MAADPPAGVLSSSGPDRWRSRGGWRASRTSTLTRFERRGRAPPSPRLRRTGRRAGPATSDLVADTGASRGGGHHGRGPGRGGLAHGAAASEGRRAGLPDHHAEPAARSRPEDREQPHASRLRDLSPCAPAAELSRARHGRCDLFRARARRVGAAGAGLCRGRLPRCRRDPDPDRDGRRVARLVDGLAGHAGRRRQLGRHARHRRLGAVLPARRSDLSRCASVGPRVAGGRGPAGRAPTASVPARRPFRIAWTCAASVALGLLPWLHTRYVILSVGLGAALVPADRGTAGLACADGLRDASGAARDGRGSGSSSSCTARRILPRRTAPTRRWRWHTCCRACRACCSISSSDCSRVRRSWLVTLVSMRPTVRATAPEHVVDCRPRRHARPAVHLRRRRVPDVVGRTVGAGTLPRAAHPAAARPSSRWVGTRCRRGRHGTWSSRCSSCRWR